MIIVDHPTGIFLAGLLLVLVIEPTVSIKDIADTNINDPKLKDREFVFLVNFSENKL